MLKIVSMCAALVLAGAAFSTSAEAQKHGGFGGGARMGGHGGFGGGARIGGMGGVSRMGGISGPRMGGPRIGAYGGRGIYRGGVGPGRIGAYGGRGIYRGGRYAYGYGRGYGYRYPWLLALGLRRWCARGGLGVAVLRRVRLRLLLRGPPRVDPVWLELAAGLRLRFSVVLRRLLLLVTNCLQLLRGRSSVAPLAFLPRANSRA
jgi:hypothetical protein